MKQVQGDGYCHAELVSASIDIKNTHMIATLYQTAEFYRRHHTTGRARVVRPFYWNIRMNEHRIRSSDPSKQFLAIQVKTGEGIQRPYIQRIGRREFVALAVSILTTASSHAAPSPQSGLDIDAFISGAFLKYETDFPLTTTPERFGRMLDDLFIMGALWEVYGFSPRYKVVRMGTVWHVIDPTGIEGTLRTVEASGLHRTFIARGKLKNWFIPKTISGRALFFLRYTTAPGGISVRFTVYGEGSDNRLEQVMLKALSPILKYHIGHRVERNLRDLGTIVTDLERDPKQVAGKLNENLAAAVIRMLELSAPR